MEALRAKKERKKPSGDQFFKFDQKCFLSCIHDLRTGEKKGFDRIFKFLNYFSFNL